ncbi:hypothetical protein IQ273_00065 [Nodosilinea sp. LEGE 07298]|uniref:hypothetical protein n=1 Tax=Nodosilinea sp. LEGE 07298 TaxID=2777970 RepID=UPI0018825BA3|nr:hypothetical protein [Nodosilinea sp. LEGE 07298]MBE9107820.1 hypothetical protein [Nodosilinea sp. LEGE 07298]
MGEIWWEVGVVDAIAYRDLRLQALKESPMVFASSYEQEAQLLLSDFATRLRPSPSAANGIFGAFSDRNHLIGMLGFSWEHRPKMGQQLVLGHPIHSLFCCVSPISLRLRPCWLSSVW